MDFDGGDVLLQRIGLVGLAEQGVAADPGSLTLGQVRIELCFLAGGSGSNECEVAAGSNAADGVSGVILFEEFKKVFE